MTKARRGDARQHNAAAAFGARDISRDEILPCRNGRARRFGRRTVQDAALTRAVADLPEALARAVATDWSAAIEPLLPVSQMFIGRAPRLAWRRNVR